MGVLVRLVDLSHVTGVVVERRRLLFLSTRSDGGLRRGSIAGNTVVVELVPKKS